METPITDAPMETTSELPQVVLEQAPVDVPVVVPAALEVPSTPLPTPVASVEVTPVVTEVAAAVTDDNKEVAAEADTKDKVVEPKKKKQRRLTLLEKDLEDKVVSEKTLDFYIYQQQKQNFISKYLTWTFITRIVDQKTKQTILGSASFHDCHLLVDFDETLKAGTQVDTVIFRGDVMKFCVFPTADHKKGGLVYDIPISPLKKVDIFEELAKK